MKVYDLTEQAQAARKHFDKLLEEKINNIQRLTGVERERLIKINPIDFTEPSKNVFLRGHNYKKIEDFVRQNKTPETFLISPNDEDVETANKICYKTGQTTRKLRAHKCQLLPISNLAAQRFFVKNHRQSVPCLTHAAINYALVYEGEVVSVMTYDLTGGGERGLAKADKYELMRLSIKHGTQINGGASKLQQKCEECILHQEGVSNEIFSYSNATVNEGNVYQQLGFTKSSILGGQAWVVERDFSLFRLLDVCSHHGGKGARNADLAKRGALKVHITANRTWIKKLEKPEEKQTATN